jgi:hypothetical protein
LATDRTIVSGLGGDDERIEMKRGGDDGDEVKYDGDDDDEAKLQVRLAMLQSGGT